MAGGGGGGGGVSKRRRSSGLKQILPQSDSRHNRVGAISVVNSASNNNTNNNLSSTGSGQLSSRDSNVSRTKNINVNIASNSSNLGGRSGISSSISSSSSASSHQKLAVNLGGSSSLFDDTKPFLQASNASIDRAGFINSKGGSKSTSNRSSFRGRDLADEYSPSPRRSIEISGRTSRSISISEASLGFPPSLSPKPPVLVHQATTEDDDVDEDEMTAVDLLLASPSTPIAWSVNDPRSEFEIILTEISSQEGTFV